MKIAIINQPTDRVQPPNLNSIGLWTYKISSILAQKHEIIVYSGQKNLFEFRNGLNFLYVPSLSSKTYRRISNIVKPFFQKDFPPFAANFFLSDYITRIAKDIQKKNFDIVHVHTYSQFVPILRKYNPHIKIILHMHCDWLNDLNYDALLPRLMMCDQIIGCSNYITEHVGARFTQLASRCSTIYNGVDINQFLPITKNLSPVIHRDYKLLFISRISPEKGVHDLIEAFNIVNIQNPNTQLFLLGQKVSLRKDFLVSISKDPLINDLSRFYKGDVYYRLLTQKINQNAINKVHFIGHVDHTEIPFYFRDSTILINPSIVEPFGISIVEAMASGVPVIATNVGGIPEIINHGSTGFLVPPASPEKLAASINSLLSDFYLRAKFGDASRKRVMGKFTWNNAAKNLNNVYNSL
jgi:glycosyltransferase involved in cell wall biosynthesis